MGGHVGRCVVTYSGCFDVYVWHDGEFPFGGRAGRDARSPIKLHHCDPDQFIEFGRFLKGIEDIAD